MSRIWYDTSLHNNRHGVSLSAVMGTTLKTLGVLPLAPITWSTSLTADLANDAATQEVTFAFSKGPIQYSPFRQEVSALMEHVGEQTNLMHASFWQRKLGLGTGKEFVLRLRLLAGEDSLREVIGVIAAAGRVGKETLIKRGKLVLGRRVL